MNEDAHDDIDGDLMVRLALRQEYAAEDWVDVDAVLAGGRQRARHARLRRAAVAGVVGVAAVGLAAVILPGMGPRSDGSAAGGVLTPCSDRPSTCNPSQVDAWIAEATGLAVSEPDIFADPPGVAGKAAVYRAALSGEEAAEVTVVVAPRGAADELFKGVAPAPTVNGDTPDPDVVGYGRAPGGAPGYWAWGLDAAAGHGAVLLIYSGPVDSLPSEEQAVRLVRGLAGA